ncbi:MAG: GNAT family N-acetyltransferase, partial [Flavobacteriaceae bacterium]
PVAFNDKDPQGYQIDGFEHLSVTATHSSLPERIELLNKLGFTKKIDLWVYKIPVRDKIPELHHKIAERSRRNNPELKLIQIKNKWQLRDLIVPIFNLVNKTFNDIYAFSPLQEREMRELSYKYLPVLDKRFVKAIENSEGEIIAFVLAMPNMSKGIIKSKGRIIPWGLLKIWASQKKTKQLDMLLGAVHPEYQNKGLDAQLAQALFKEARDAGFEFLDSHLELETNTKMHAENIKLGGEIYKKYRIFQKSI